MIRFALIIPVTLLAACETMPHSRPGRCDASRVQSFVGALGTADVSKTIFKRSGAKALRWIPPGTMVTMDYRIDRLNIRIDARNFITAIDCG
jgi:hypothetical protein